MRWASFTLIVGEFENYLQKGNMGRTVEIQHRQWAQGERIFLTWLPYLIERLEAEAARGTLTYDD